MASQFLSLVSLQMIPGGFYFSLHLIYLSLMNFYFLSDPFLIFCWWPSPYLRRTHYFWYSVYNWTGLAWLLIFDDFSIIFDATTARLLISSFLTYHPRFIVLSSHFIIRTHHCLVSSSVRDHDCTYKYLSLIHISFNTL